MNIGQVLLQRAGMKDAIVSSQEKHDADNKYRVGDGDRLPVRDTCGHGFIENTLQMSSERWLFIFYLG